MKYPIGLRRAQGETKGVGCTYHTTHMRKIKWPDKQLDQDQDRIEAKNVVKKPRFYSLTLWNPVSEIWKTHL